MNFDPNNVADFLKHPLFLKWITTDSPDLEKFWEDWCRDHPEKITLFRQARQILKSLQWKETHEMQSADKEKILNKVIHFNRTWENKVDNKAKFKKRVKRTISWAVPVAAVFLLVGFLMAGFLDLPFIRQQEEAEIEWIVKTVPRGVKKSFTLPDGSKVTLNSSSEIRYPTTFNQTREIRLTGQGFFEIKENPKLPFSVHTSNLKTTVLGTSFDVKAYPDQNNLIVAVVTGRVIVETPNGITAILNKSEATLYQTESGALQKTDFDYDLLVGWKEKKLKFHEENYEEVFSRLSQWFDVEFVVTDGSYPESEYTGYFFDQSLDNILRGMRYSLGFEYEIEGKVVTLKFKNN